MPAMTQSKKRRGGRPKSADPKRTILTLKGSEEWREWVHRLAGHMRTKAPDLIDRALVEIAERNGFKERAPKR